MDELIDTCATCKELKEVEVKATCGNYCSNCVCHDCGEILEKGEEQICTQCMEEWEEELMDKN
jgi:hypothetical protein